jgi:phosphoglycolate phosphatase-like HAD superfamily hydrolase
MSRTRIQLVITDLDNTLYDWYSSFVPAFYAMVKEAARVMGADESELLDDLQAVHRRHGNSEHPFALIETRRIARTFPGLSKQEILERLDPAFHAFNRLRKENLKLYEGVRETLEQLSHLRVPVVAYTDARIINSLTRLRKLGIRSLFARLYAPAVVIELEDQSELLDDFVRLLPASDRKPNPRTLADICAETDTPCASALYIGDSLVRDIYMARLAGVCSAWARYGARYDRALWQQLTRVTHWTDEDVAREQELRQQSQSVEADCVLEKFSDIFRCYEFRSAETSSVTA